MPAADPEKLALRLLTQDRVERNEFASFDIDLLSNWLSRKAWTRTSLCQIDNLIGSLDASRCIKQAPASSRFPSIGNSRKEESDRASETSGK